MLASRNIVKIKKIHIRCLAESLAQGEAQDMEAVVKMVRIEKVVGRIGTCRSQLGFRSEGGSGKA